MSDNDEIGNVNLSDNESIAASLDSGISDDSGIEDWNDEMTVQTDQEEISVFSQQQQQQHETSSSKHLHSPVSPKEDLSTNECIFPSLPDTLAEIQERKDIVDDSAIQGVCGLNNLGNTCFMNATLQCLIATSTIQNLVTQGDILQNGSDHMHEPSAVLIFIERFQEMILKVLSGKYILLHPNQFHAAVHRLHPSFADFKQHDAQEFLSFLLNTLHDLLNRSTALSKNIENKDSGVVKEDEEDFSGEVSKRLKMDNSMGDGENMETETDAGVECEGDISKEEKAWREYICGNQSIIADSFQGQFQSVITCEKCSFISTTHEPFMFLSLPIPHAMEKQIVVTWVPSRKTSCISGIVKKYLVVVNKNGCISDVKKHLYALMDNSVNCNDIILAEASNASTVKILDDRTQLSYLSKTKDIYGIEVITSLDAKNNDVSEKSSDDVNTSDNKSITNDINNASAWHSCSICLDETFDENLKVHSICGGFLCYGCLTSTSVFHNGQTFPCPICNRYINTDDYKPLVDENNVNEEKQFRQVLVPVMFRHDALDKKSTRKYGLFGHPVICSLLSEVSPDTVLELVNQVLQPLSQLSISFDVIITDGAGLSCGRCEMFSPCSGCLVKEQDILLLKPGSCITVHFHEISDDIINILNSCEFDKSMSLIRTSDTVMLGECLETFATTELLTEDNPWFCPQCKTNRIATKCMTVTRWPQTLIIHLKRFYFEGSQGYKITCPIDYPLTDLNVAGLTSEGDDVTSDGDDVMKTNYDLYSIICHTGSLFGGHYTSFSKASSSEEWYRFNDETFKQMEPSIEHQSESYVLFYERKRDQNTSLRCEVEVMH